MLNYYIFRQILWIAHTLHEAFEAISLFSNLSFSKDLIKICYSAFSYSAIIADTKALTLAEWGKEEENDKSGARGATVNLIALEVPPPGAGLWTVIDAVPLLARSAAGTVAVSAKPAV